MPKLKPRLMIWPTTITGKAGTKAKATKQKIVTVGSAATARPTPK